MLYEKLKQYAQSDYYPFHMPGHKRRMGSFVNPYEIDITEIEGFDNLHHAEGVLANIETNLSQAYESEETKMLINGSTCGILAAISGCVWTNGRLLTARNCHKAVYNGMLLTKCRSAYVYPQYVSEYGIAGGILPEDVENACKNYKDIQAVLITSPTYDGVVSDVEAIAKIVHQYNIPLIVDEAHGAHFQFDDRFPVSALHKGADIVINSLHKTLPSFTQTAVLHMQGNLIDRERIKKYLAIYQTSSPSYLLMASIEQCMEILYTQGKTSFDQLNQYLDEFYEKMKMNKKICLAEKSMIGHNGVYDFDRSKLILSVCNASITGIELYNVLLNRYHLQMEMAAEQYVTGITTLADEKAGFDRLWHALTEISKEVDFINFNYSAKHTLCKPEMVYTLSEVQEKKMMRLPIEKSAGCVSGEMVYSYPPGIPLLVPGEKISKDMVDNIIRGRRIGLKIEGASDHTANTILTVAE